MCSPVVSCSRDALTVAVTESLTFDSVAPPPTLTPGTSIRDFSPVPIRSVPPPVTEKDTWSPTPTAWLAVCVAERVNDRPLSPTVPRRSRSSVRRCRRISWPPAFRTTGTPEPRSLAKRARMPGVPKAAVSSR